MQTSKRAPPWRAGITPLIDETALQARIAQLGADITEAFGHHANEGLVALGVLRGSFPFYADLVRRIDLPMACEFVQLSSYGHGQQTSGEVRVGLDLTCDVSGRHVLVVEDIVDSGLSMRHLIDALLQRGSKSVSVCTLLHKSNGTRVHVPLHYVGFSIPDAFVVGYGLDYCAKLRNLPYVGVVDPAAEAALAKVLCGSDGELSKGDVPGPQEAEEPHATH